MDGEDGGGGACRKRRIGLEMGRSWNKKKFVGRSVQFMKLTNRQSQTISGSNACENSAKITKRAGIGLLLNQQEKSKLAITKGK
jgi:hypothetical protein